MDNFDPQSTFILYYSSGTFRGTLSYGDLLSDCGTNKLKDLRSTRRSETTELINYANKNNMNYILYIDGFVRPATLEDKYRYASLRSMLSKALDFNEYIAQEETKFAIRCLCYFPDIRDALHLKLRFSDFNLQMWNGGQFPLHSGE